MYMHKKMIPIAFLFKIPQGLKINFAWYKMQDLVLHRSERITYHRLHLSWKLLNRTSFFNDHDSSFNDHDFMFINDHDSSATDHDFMFING